MKIFHDHLNIQTWIIFEGRKVTKKTEVLQNGRKAMLGEVEENEIKNRSICP